MPSQRNPENKSMHRKRRSADVVDPKLIARLDTPKRSFYLKWTSDDATILDEDEVPGVLLGVRPAMTWMELTSLSVEDLELLREMFLLAIDKAMPLARHLDELADRMWQEGKMPRRLYRQPARFINFEAPMPPIKKSQPDKEGPSDVQPGQDQPVPE